MRRNSVTWLGLTPLLLSLAACSAAPSGSVGPTVSPVGGAQTDEPTEPEGTPEPAATSTPAGPTATTGTGAELDVNRLATGERPAGWVEVQSNSPDCTMALPGDWTLMALGAAWFNGVAPDDHMSARAVQDPVTTWPEYIAHLKATYFNELSGNGEVTLVDTERLFVMRETANGGKAHIMALNGGVTACGIVESIDEVAAQAWAATAIDILYTLSGPDIGASATP